MDREIQKTVSAEKFFSCWDPSRCVDLYGQGMGPSALADQIEWWVLRGGDLPLNSLIGFLVHDAGIPGNDVLSGYAANKAYSSELSCHDSYSESDDESSFYFEGGISSNDSAIDLIRFRMDYLGDRYPIRFSSDGTRLKCCAVESERCIPYLILLAISLIKGWIYPNHKAVLGPITKLMESVVYSAMRCRGLEGEVLGTSAGDGFNRRVKEVARKLRLTINEEVLKDAFPPASKDAGVDIIGGSLFKDGRIGEQFWLIQVACGKAKAWNEKLYAVDAGRWDDLFNEVVTPISYLAVPYHISSRWLKYGLQKHKPYSYLDRLRLARMLDGRFGEYGQRASEQVDALSEQMEALYELNRKWLDLPLCQSLSD